MRMSLVILFVSVPWVAVTACGDDTSTTPPDASWDASQRDVGPDAPVFRDAVSGDSLVVDSATTDAEARDAGQPDAAPGTCRDNGECPGTEYCKKVDCGDEYGVCTPRPTVCQDVEDLVCGCDGTIYWNSCLAERMGRNVAYPGVCQPGDVAECGGLLYQPCPTPGSLCAYLFETEDGCNIADATGTCWVLPSRCPGIVIGGQWRPCTMGNAPCKGLCDAVRSGRPHWHDTSCPQ